MELTGQIERIRLNIGSEAYAKSELILKMENPNTTEYVNIEFGGTRASLPEQYHDKIGETITVSINIGGRAWTNPQNEVIYFRAYPY